VRVHGNAPLHAYAFDALVFHRRIAEDVLAFRTLRDRLAGDHEDSLGDELDRRADGDGSMVDLAGLGILDRLPEPDLDFVMQNAEHRWHTAGAAIVRQGEPGDRFYVLLEGDVTVARDDREMARLSAGDFFGETALLLDMPRTATVRATRDAHTWSITRSAFQRLVGSYLLSNPRTQEEIMRRLSVILPETHPPMAD
jgi:CRP-like cAMP-binding protein